MDDLEQIKQKIDIVNFIGENITLKKAGRNFKGLCPFHGEKTPSFVVSPERQIWHCFGCNLGGDIFSYLMKLDNLEFVEALKILANRAGVKLSQRPGESKSSQLKERLLQIHHLAAEYYHYILASHKLGERARIYLKQRGISDKAIATFGLGFAPASWNNLAKFLIKKSFSEFELRESGLLSRGQNNWFDRFRDRIIFPLQNHRGETIAFAGRVLNPDVKEAKYINSPETPIYIKSNTLYGLNITKDAIKKAGMAIVVEGEFDLISSFQAGVANVVAIKGSALTEAQVILIKRFTDRLILALDADKAGDQAQRRGIEIADNAGMDLRVVKIPQGKDPDDAARENPQTWIQAVKSAVPVYEFFIDSAFSRYPENDIYAKRKITDELLLVFKKITNPVIQGHYLKRLSEKLNISEEKLVEAMNKIRINLPIYKKYAEIKTEVKNHEELVESHLLALVLQAKDIHSALNLVTEIIDPTDFNQIPVRKIFINLIDKFGEDASINIDEFSKTLPSEIVSAFDTAILSDLSAFTDDENFLKELKKTIIVAKISILRRKIKTASQAMSQAQNEDNETKISELKTSMQELATDLKALS